MHDRPIRFLVFSLVVIGACGSIGVAVDIFDIYKALYGGPYWLNQLDVLVAVAYSVIIGGVDAYYRRYVRTRETATNRQRNSGIE